MGEDSREPCTPRPPHRPATSRDARHQTCIPTRRWRVSLRPGDACLPAPPRQITLSYAMATLTVRLPDRLRRDLEKLSKERGRPAGEIVRDSLRRYLATERFRALRAKALPFAEAQGLLTDEDVFKTVS